MIAPALLSSKTDEWGTPADLFAQLNRRFGPFDLDVCATDQNAKCPRFYAREQDGLQHDWAGTCWMNPPYGRTIGKWVRKAWESSRAGATVVCLLPARVDTKWWWDFVKPFGEIEFIRGRLRFGDGCNSAPFPSAVVVFRPGRERTCERCGRTYVPRRQDARYCSAACKQAAYRHRRVTDKAVTEREK